MDKKITFGFPRMHKEPGERRDFSPTLIHSLHRHGAQICLEFGYGNEMGVKEFEYVNAAPDVRFVSRTEAYQQDNVLVLRCPTDDELRLLRPGACIISMLHYPTRPQRVEFLRSLGVEAVSLDSLKDDSGRRMVEYLRAVGWNGVEIAFRTLQANYPSPGFDAPGRRPIQVTLLGPGAVGAHAMQAAANYGNAGLRRELAARGVPGGTVTAVDYDLTGRAEVMRPLLKRTDILVDATQRPDPSRPVIPNAWVGWLPKHAVLLDLSVDPYSFAEGVVTVKGIEGIPQGNLDRYVFAPDDPAFDALPPQVDTRQRRWSVSCYSWPGIYPLDCMEWYGRQIQPILRMLIERGGVAGVNPEGRYFERAIGRALLSRWTPDGERSPAPGRKP